MKKHILKLRQPVVLMCVALAMIFQGCGKDKSADLTDLLVTVPSDASAVMAINVKNVLEKSDCKVSDGKVVPGKKMQEVISGIGNASDREGISRFMTGDYGIDPSVAMIFAEGQDVYLIGFLDEPSRFKAQVEKETGDKFSSRSDIETCSNMAVKGNRFWVRLSHRNDISADEISRFMSLNDKLSFLSNRASEEMEKLDHDIEGWGNIGGVFNILDMGFAQKSMTRMAISAFYADAEEFAFKADFDRGELEAELKLLNSKGKPAKFIYDTRRIDVASVKDAASRGECVIAAAISPSMVEKLKENVGDKGISMMAVYTQLLSPVDGTCVAVQGENGTIRGLFTTKGEGTASLSDALSSMGCRTSKDGKILRFDSGDVQGNLVVAEVADEFKDALAGIVVSPQMMKQSGYDIDIRNLSLMLVPDDGSVELKLEMKGNDSKQNIIYSLIK